jgi:hypothetical protein
MLCRLIIVLVLIVSLSIQLASPTKACGPFSIEPIFVFHESPDLPFREFTKGKIGIIQPTFGRKTLVIAYRYLNGGMFSDDEQNALVEALAGQAPEENGADALKAWIAARRELLTENDSLPEIYRERKSSGYDFFPNCAKNAFEVAASTLKDRVSSYGAADPNVKEWITAQDLVFQNCSGGEHIPTPATAGGPRWLQKDREYQIAAAFFYSLNFDEARSRFAKIATDIDSPWQDTANYLVARTLVRQASLTKDEAAKLDLNSKAEMALQSLASQSASFQTSAKKLLALVKFRLHPEERVQELAPTLAMSGNENLRQDLIDYVWLVDQFEARILTAEKKRKDALKPPEEREREGRTFPDEQSRLRNEALERGEIISITFTPRAADGAQDYRNYLALDFKYDAPESEILATFESKLYRKLTDQETKDLKDNYESQLHYRELSLSPNRKWGQGGMSDHEGPCYDCGKLTFDLIPDYLRRDDLTDWMLTLKTPDVRAYAYALKRWHETSLHAWLVAALIKADKSSPGRDRLIREAESVGRDAPEFPTVAHELARLKISLGQNEAARKLIDDVLTNFAGALPISARNQFLEQRAHLADGLSNFLKYSQRVPVAFYNDESGHFGSLSDQLRFAKGQWNSEYGTQTKEEWDGDVEKEYQDLLPWDKRSIFAAEAIDVFNWHFPLPALAAAGRDRSVPDYLRRQILLAAWTRAVVLNRYDEALQLTPDVIKVAPEMAPLLNEFLRAQPSERAHAALFVILKFPKLSPYLATGLPSFDTSEGLDYYFETAWWCELPATEYNDAGEEVSKKIRRPDFLSAPQLAAAAAERKQLDDLGVGKSYLGKLVLEWAKASPNDPRVPEALFIAYQANDNYKYGCGGWEHNEEIQQETEELLRQRYAASAWTARLPNNK